MSAVWILILLYEDPAMILCGTGCGKAAVWWLQKGPIRWTPRCDECAGRESVWSILKPLTVNKLLEVTCKGHATM